MVKLVEDREIKEIRMKELKRGDIVVVGYNQKGMPRMDQIIGYFHLEPDTLT